MSITPTRDKALELLTRYNKSESLLKHALAVEAVMRHFAGKLGEDVEKWGIIGLIHDVDYEMYPDAHCIKAREILESEGWPEDYIHAVQSHGYKICTEVRPDHTMEKVLYTIDELTGLITATVLMRPDKRIEGLEVRSVIKKWKQKSFAAGVNRQIIEEGAQMLGMQLYDIIEDTIKGMQKEASALGL
ncbi:MAG TPA: HDIG domain-containing protein [Candidatus Atribacteria bacterium]|nr:HDIG domain-containing protein [Candidatus Atribacteria bacterium]